MSRRLLRFKSSANPHISQAEKFLAVVAGQMPLNFQLDVQVREKVSKVHLLLRIGASITGTSSSRVGFQA
jgi:hypothetical protein